MILQQTQISLKAKPRGFHVITHEITRSLYIDPAWQQGILHLFLQHTSASLSLNENTDPDVLEDLEYFFNRSIPEHDPKYLHTCEGPDDLPAHIKSATLGTSLTIPICYGKLALGTWQGIVLGEHRNHASARSLIATIMANQ